MLNDLTKGKPLKLIIAFTLPLLIGNIFQQFYSMADTIIVGRTLGVDAVAAVGATGSISFLIIGFALGLTGGFAVITSQRYGAGDLDGVRKSITTSIFLSVISTVILTVISMLGARSLLEMMQTPQNIIEDSYTYIIIIFAGIFASMFYNLISSILRALGDSLTPLIFLIVASVLNIILDFVFILAFGMGVEGPAIATVLSQFISGLLCLFYTMKKFPMLHLKKQDWKLDLDFTFQHLRVAVPMALQFSITAIGAIVLQWALNPLGSTTIAAFTAAAKIDQLVGQPICSLGIAMATYAAQNYGANRIDRVKKGVNTSIIFSMTLSVVGAVLILLVGRFLIGVFVGADETEVIELGMTYFKWVVGFYPILGLLFIYRNVLQGLGYAFTPMMAGVCELVMRIFAAFYLTANFGYIGACLAGPAAWVGAVLLLLPAYFVSMHKITRRYKECLSKAQAVSENA